MAQNKYVIFKAEDAQGYLGPEQQNQLIALLQQITSGRQQAGKSVGDLFFVLNMKDRYAQPAIESYINAIATDQSVDHNQHAQECLRVAREVRTTAMMKVAPGVPD